jgi:asparagine synthase (glutamine-hydrolysing)
MCGIAGILLFKQDDLYLQHRLQKMAATMVHRGPDDEGYVLFSKNDIIPCGGKDTPSSSWNNSINYSAQKSIEETVPDVFMGMAHRRLSVIDLTAAGHQPMCNEDASIWIACNGEIYNYIELRSELESLGVVFKTKSDIEVLLKAYEFWDLRFIDKLNGMWSFVIYDKRKNILLGCRDRFGVKPFYYTLQEDFLAFASEQKALLTLPFKKDIHDKAVFDYLVHGRVESGETGYYQHIKELMPSHYFMYDLNQKQFSLQRYYQLSFFSGYRQADAKTSGDYISHIKDKIFHAVDLRLRSDVPVGFCLSGGIDSSSIIGVAKQINDNKHLSQLQGSLHAFTATHSGHDCDESAWASLVVDKYNLNWQKAPCTSEKLFEELESMIYYQDSPLFTTSTYAQNTVMKAAKENGITILLDGQGGDELFAGYVPVYISFYFELLRQFRLGRLTKEWFHLNRAPLDGSILFKSMMKVALNQSLPNSFKKGLYKCTHKETSFISNDFFAQNSSEISLSPDYSDKSMNFLLHDFFTRHYLKNILRWEDRCSMQYSIESRTPFADDISLIEYMFSIPSSYKIHHGWSKYLLRQAMKEVLPESIYRRRDKLGFATPQTHWLMQQNERMKTMLFELYSFDTDKIVSGSKILGKWETIFSIPKHSQQQDFVWRYINYLLWRKVNGI